MFGNRSDASERAAERLLAITQTCRLQRISALTYLTAAITGHRNHQ
jgi:hypothetical protein